MTLVLVKREAGARRAPRRSPGASTRFRRSWRSPTEVFAERALDPRLRPIVDFALEELFTNMVKYSPMGVADVRIDVAAIEGGVEVALTDYGVAPFDVTQRAGRGHRRADRAARARRAGAASDAQAGGLAEYDYDEQPPREPDHVPRHREPALAAVGRRRDWGRGMLAIDYGNDGAVVVTGRLDAAQAPTAQAFLDRRRRAR